ncbi:MAG: acyltransferase [Oscillospiraceae bacterium]|nr:acyltransferase [Oscillospiraceae bacterium]
MDVIAERAWGVHDTLSIAQSQVIRGLAAVLLVCVHIGNVLDYAGIYGSLLSPFGYLLVGIFLFYSGYGISLGLKKRNNKIDRSKYIAKHLIKYILLMIVVEGLYYVEYLAFSKETFSFLKMVKHLAGWDMLAGQMWTILTLVIIYATMIILFQLFDWNGKEILISVICIGVYVFYLLLRGRPFHEMQSCVAFVLGVAVASVPGLSAKIIPKQGKVKLIAVLVATVCFAFSNLVIYGVRYFWNDYHIVRVSMGWISVISFLVLLFNFLDVFVVGNKVLSKFGSVSTEIYLLHVFVINLFCWSFPQYFKSADSSLLSLLIIVVTVLLSFIVVKVKGLSVFSKKTKS